MDVNTVCVEHKGINEHGELEITHLTKCEDAECINWFEVKQGDTQTRSCGDCCTEYLDDNYDYNRTNIYWEHHEENECNDCGRNVPEEEYDSSLGHCLECHGG